MAAGPDTEPEAGQGNASISPEAPTTKGRDASPEDARPSASGTDDSPCRDDRNRDPAGKAGGWTGRRLLRLCIRTLSLGLFIWFLCRTAFPLSVAELPVDSFLRLDPLVAVATSLAARQWIVALWPGLVLLILTLAAGRLFCGYICPLGVTLDVSRRVGGKKRPTGPATTRQEHKTFGPGADAAPRRAKFVFLALLLGAALAGYNLVFWGSPIPLVTRLYALLLHPTLMFAGKEAYETALPAVQALDIPSLAYLQILPRRFDTLYFLFFFFGAVFLLEQLRPRFWCRYLCPAGALLALFSFRPLLRRGVHTCIHCGRCAAACPTGAIPRPETRTRHSECITCRTCVDVCPVRGVTFSLKKPRPAAMEQPASSKAEVPGELLQNEVRQAEFTHGGAGKVEGCLPSRRLFLVSTATGVGLALVGHSHVRSLLTGSPRGLLWPEGCIRPPGSVPEPGFLDRCLRCGLCMKVCPGNALQPAWFQAGVEGMFSPVLTARRGPCEPECNACGHVCPTGAILPLPMEEKQWAKIGTAVVERDRCLAWAEGRSCVVCEEVCPYGAIRCERREGAGAPVPVIRPERCYGCGYCEHHCPVRIPAIIVLPLNALRLAAGTYQETARNAGLSLIPASKMPPYGQGAPEPGSGQLLPDQLPPGQLPPGFSN